jgi:hypothetical protein
MAAEKLLITVEFEMDEIARPGDREWLIDKFSEVIRDEAYNTGLTKFCHTDTLEVGNTGWVAEKC